MPSTFDDYLSGLQVSTGGKFGNSQGAIWNPDGTRASGSGNWVRSMYGPSFQYIKEGSEAAGALLRKSYADAYRARAAGFAGSMDERERGYGADIASQGLSPDVAVRLMREQRVGGIQDLAQARGQSEAEMDQALAGLAKGTATEFAGLNRDQVKTLMDYLMARRAAKAGQTAALYSAAGQGIGAGVGAYGALSDPRLKINAVCVGAVKLVDGVIPIYEYEYRDPNLTGVYRGVMAPDVEHLGVVGVSKSGYQYVDYMRLEELTGFKFRKVADAPNRRRRRAKKAAGV